jgi:hypothetical protein
MVEAGIASNSRRGRMSHRTLSALLILSLFATSSDLALGQGSEQNVTEMRKIALKAIEKNRKVTALLKNGKDKEKLTGVPSNVSEQGFTLVDQPSLTRPFRTSCNQVGVVTKYV